MYQQQANYKIPNPFDSILEELDKELKEHIPTATQLGKNIDAFTIMSASITGHLDISKKKIRGNRSCLNKKSFSGWTPLMHSMVQGCSELTVKFLELGAETDVLNPRGMTALGVSAAFGHRGTIKSFCKHFCGKKLLNEMSEVHLSGNADLLAFSKEDEEEGAALTRLLNEVNRKDAFGRTALHYCAQGAHEDAAAVLIKYGAELEAEDIEGATPFYYACQTGEAEFIKFMFEEGGDPHKCNKLGIAPISLLPMEIRSLLGMAKEQDSDVDSFCFVEAKNEVLSVDGSLRSSNSSVEEKLEKLSVKEAEKA